MFDVVRSGAFEVRVDNTIGVAGISTVERCILASIGIETLNGKIGALAATDASISTDENSSIAIFVDAVSLVDVATHESWIGSIAQRRVQRAVLENPNPALR